MSDEYFLGELEELEKKNLKKNESLKKYKEFYKQGKGRDNPMYKEQSLHNQIISDLNSSFPKEFYQGSPADLGDESHLASLGMTYALEKTQPSLMLNSVKLYEKIGMGNRKSVQRRLMKFVRKNYNNLPPGYVGEVKEFLKRNQDDKKGGLEKTLVNVSLIMFVIAGIFFLTPSLTGGVIGATKASTNIIGIALIIIGFIGFLIYRFSGK
jgi:hypothetical protein